MDGSGKGEEVESLVISKVLQEPDGRLDWCEDVRDGESGQMVAMCFRSGISRAS